MRAPFGRWSRLAGNNCFSVTGPQFLLNSGPRRGTTFPWGDSVLYIAIFAAALFSTYTWAIAYGQLRRRNYLGGFCLSVMGVLILGLGLWEAFMW